MDIIKKKISLEQFKTRLYTPLKTVNNHETNGSWGEMPVPITIEGKTLKYGTMMDLYHKAIQTLNNIVFYEYDGSGKKWITPEIDWYSATFNLVVRLPETPEDKTIYGVLTQSDLSFINEYFVNTFGFNGVEYVKKVGIILNSGNDKDVTVEKETGYSTLTLEIPILLTTSINDLGLYKTDDSNKCYWYQSTDPAIEMQNTNSNEISTYAEKYLGFIWVDTDTQKAYVFSKGEKIGTQDLDYKNIDTKATGITEPHQYYWCYIKKPHILTGITGESKLQTLRKRKRSYDDNGNELPGIYDGTNELVNPYQTRYFKNIQLFNDKAYGDTIYTITVYKKEITIVYVIGARLKVIGNVFILDETSPYNLTPRDIIEGNWEGEGVWYKETYPYIEDTIDFVMNGEKKSCSYGAIDFSSVMTTYSYKGIDFPRKNYILCTDIRYKSDSYLSNSESFFIYRDDKMGSISENVKEKYDVAIDRGAAAAYEKHLVLTEVKTFQDLELLRNNMFNI